MAQSTAGTYANIFGSDSEDEAEEDLQQRQYSEEAAQDLDGDGRQDEGLVDGSDRST